MDLLKKIIGGAAGAVILLVLVNIDTIGIIIAEKLGLPYFNFTCTNFFTCYLAPFNGTLNSIVYFWIPALIIFGVYKFVSKK